MVYHSTANASISTVGSNMKEFVKKKWVNRRDKLNRCKLDVRHVHTVAFTSEEKEV
ncbi:hypothetical protein HanPI659440_Chr17g0696221 [Helianthus annuus]|nr:hypothetical protein HanPI659440_Chr17g0696221 [Helianthus annuus]